MSLYVYIRADILEEEEESSANPQLFSSDLELEVSAFLSGRLVSDGMQREEMVLNHSATIYNMRKRLGFSFLNEETVFVQNHQSNSDDVKKGSILDQNDRSSPSERKIQYLKEKTGYSNDDNKSSSTMKKKSNSKDIVQGKELSAEDQMNAKYFPSMFPGLKTTHSCQRTTASVSLDDDKEEDHEDDEEKDEEEDNEEEVTKRLMSELLQEESIRYYIVSTKEALVPWHTSHTGHGVPIVILLPDDRGWKCKNLRNVSAYMFMITLHNPIIFEFFSLLLSSLPLPYTTTPNVNV
jgi:hypothetical protein